jgi:stringent starvation protein B
MSAPSDIRMTSNRPYLLRAMYEWIGDNGMSPYLLVDANAPGVRVPPSTIREGKVVLNVAARAVAQLNMGNESIQFLARFGGVSQSVEIPVSAVQAIYAQETGQGMMMAPEADSPEPLMAGDEPDPSDNPPEPPKRGAHLRVIK